MLRSTAKLVCTLLAAAGLGACGAPPGDRGVTTGGEAPPRAPAAGADRGPGTVNVAIEGLSFKPERTQIRVGQTVKWTNDEPIVHDVTASGEAFESGPLQSGEDYEFKPRRAGSFRYLCTIHGDQMSGTLVVRSP